MRAFKPNKLKTWPANAGTSLGWYHYGIPQSRRRFKRFQLLWQRRRQIQTDWKCCPTAHVNTFHCLATNRPRYLVTWSNLIYTVLCCLLLPHGVLRMTELLFVRFPCPYRDRNVPIPAITKIKNLQFKNLYCLFYFRSTFVHDIIICVTWDLSYIQWLWVTRQLLLSKQFQYNLYICLKVKSYDSFIASWFFACACILLCVRVSSTHWNYCFNNNVFWKSRLTRHATEGTQHSLHSHNEWRHPICS